jgi:hypothetical protein
MPRIAAELIPEQIEGNAVDPCANHGLITKLMSAFPAACPGSLRDFFGLRVRQPFGRQETNSALKSFRVGDAELCCCHAVLLS